MSTLCIGDSHIKRLKSHLGVQSSASAFNIAGLSPVHFVGISGGLISCDRHLRNFSAAVNRFRPRHLIVCLGGNDLDTSEWNAECVITRLVTFLTQLKNTFLLKTVTVLSYFPRQRTRTTSLQIYQNRVIEANCLLQDLCKFHGLTFWRLRGFSESKQQILCDGVHLNKLGFHKLIRQLRGILLSQCRCAY